MTRAFTWPPACVLEWAVAGLRWQVSARLVALKMRGSQQHPAVAPAGAAAVGPRGPAALPPARLTPARSLQCTHTSATQPSSLAAQPQLIAACSDVLVVSLFISFVLYQRFKG